MSARYYKKSLKFIVLGYIRQQPGVIILRNDIKNMGSSRQISRCFKDLVEMKELVQISYGVYAKSYLSENLKKTVILGGFDQACKEALTKLSVKWEPSSAEQAYNAGLSTQVPVRVTVRLKSRLRRRLAYGNRVLLMEDGTNAR